MPWPEQSLMSQREALVKSCLDPASEVADLCRHFGVSRKTAYKWIKRFASEGVSGLADRSRRPHHMPRQKVDAAMEAAILELRTTRRWGARKIGTYLILKGWTNVPSASTIHAILMRNDMPKLCNRSGLRYQRFEADRPNDLLQMDFKGPIRIHDGFVEPLTVLDDYSRFSLGIRVCENKRDITVRQHLTDIFRTYGLPDRILADNGTPWGSFGTGGRYQTHFSVWLMTLGVGLVHSRPYHPQTCGKEERFHRTMKQELTGKAMDCRMDQCQAIFDQWRDSYNSDRPHEALGMAMPSQRYTASKRSFPETIKAPEYLSTDATRRVQDQGRVCYKGQRYRIGEAYRGYNVAVRDTELEHRKEVYFYQQKIAEIDLITGKKVLPMSPNNV